jgi:hypothetical protein
MSLSYECADINKIEHKFNRTAGLAGRTGYWPSARGTPVVQGEQLDSTKSSERFHNDLVSVYAEKKFPAYRKFNMDESGTLTVPKRVPKVISPNGKKIVCRVTSGERGQTVTVVCCMSPTGIFVPPAMIFARKRMKPELFTDCR